MQPKHQANKNKQLKGFTKELAELSKKYGIILSVEPKKVKYAQVKNIEYGIGEDYGCTKIYPKKVDYIPLNFDPEKRFNCRPLTEYGFYRDCLRLFENPMVALEYWELVHSIITQVSGEESKTIGHYLDSMGAIDSKPLLFENKQDLINDFSKIYTNHIDRDLTNFINNYESYAECRDWD